MLRYTAPLKETFKFAQYHSSRYS